MAINLELNLYWDVWIGCDDSHGKRLVSEGLQNDRLI